MELLIFDTVSLQNLASSVFHSIKILLTRRHIFFLKIFQNRILAPIQILSTTRNPLSPVVQIYADDLHGPSTKPIKRKASHTRRIPTTRFVRIPTFPLFSLIWPYSHFFNLYRNKGRLHFGEYWSSKHSSWFLEFQTLNYAKFRSLPTYLKSANPQIPSNDVTKNLLITPSHPEVPFDWLGNGHLSICNGW